MLAGDRPPSVRLCDEGILLEFGSVTFQEHQVHGTQINMVSMASTVSWPNVRNTTIIFIMRQVTVGLILLHFTCYSRLNIVRT
jgi:hypothetical protein